jgi:hypothetical protein
MPLYKTAEPFCGFGHKSLFSAKLRRFACKPELKGDQVGALPSIYGMPHTADVKNATARVAFL